MADTNFLGEGRELIVNKNSIIGTIGVEADPTVKFLQIASVMSKDTFYAGVPGHYGCLFAIKHCVTENSSRRD